MEKPVKPRLRWPWIAGCLFLAIGIASGAYALRVRELRRNPLSAFQTPAPTSTPAPKPENTPEILSEADVSKNTPSPAFAAKTNQISIVLLGVDSDEEREKKGRGYRSDTIAILVLDLNAPSCRVISVPRDTRVKVRRLNSHGKVIARQYNKINSAFHYGGGPTGKGHENLLFSLNELFFGDQDSPAAFSYYASIDMEGIAPFTDAVGGVPVTLTYDVPGFGKKGETISLTGEQAQSFVRLRHGITGGSDLGRIGRQQAFVKGFAARIKQMGAKKAVLNLWKSLSTYVHTNLSLDQILVLADALSRLDLANAAFEIVPGKCRTIDSRIYYVSDSGKLEKLTEEVWGIA